MKIIVACSLCGHPYGQLSGEAEMSEHMAEVHGLYFDSGEIFRRAPGWRRVADGRATLEP